jgi:hypothetical protein
MAELLYAGAGIWLLGVVRFSWPAYQKAARTIAQLHQTVTKLPYQGGDSEEHRPELVSRAKRNAAKLAYNRLCLQGYRHIDVYRVQGAPTSAIVHDFQYRDFEHRIFADWGLDVVLEQALATEDQGKLTRINKLRDAIRTHGTAAYRFIGGHQKHVPTIGSKEAAA